jgi:hypothetical protein
MTKMLKWLKDQLWNSTNTPATGYLGELLVMHMLEGTRWKVYRPKARKAGDLWVTDTLTGEVLKVEVKTSTTGWQGSFQFCLRKPGHTTIDHADVVILLCIDGDDVYPYVIPVKFFEQRVKAAISSHPDKYAGRWATFLQQADTLSLATDMLNLLVAQFHGETEARYAVV